MDRKSMGRNSYVLEETRKGTKPLGQEAGSRTEFQPGNSISTNRYSAIFGFAIGVYSWSAHIMLPF
jgi:hypothetical protein